VTFLAPELTRFRRIDRPTSQSRRRRQQRDACDRKPPCGKEYFFGPQMRIVRIPSDKLHSLARCSLHRQDTVLTSNRQTSRRGEAHRASTCQSLAGIRTPFGGSVTVCPLCRACMPTEEVDTVGRSGWPFVRRSCAPMWRWTIDVAIDACVNIVTSLDRSNGLAKSPASSATERRNTEEHNNTRP
jgi:hypothetical protein